MRVAILALALSFFALLSSAAQQTPATNPHGLPEIFDTYRWIIGGVP